MLEVTLYGLAAIGVSALLNDVYLMVGERKRTYRELLITAASMVIVHAMVFSVGVFAWIYFG